MEDKRKKLTFKNDDEFFDFAVNPVDVFERTNEGILYHTWNFSDRYNKAVEDGVEFVIEDENSLIAKRKSVCFRTICKPVENVTTTDW